MERVPELPVQALEKSEPGRVCSADPIGRILKSDQTGRNWDDRSKASQMHKRKLNVLSELKVGHTAIVSKLNLPAAVQYHLMHMGIMPEASVLALRRAPAGDPTVYAVDGIEIALRRETAQSILLHTPALLVIEAG